MKYKKNDYYNALNFDNSGSLIFTEKQLFNVDSNRWNKDDNKLTEINIINFVNQVKIKASLVKKIIITFSPSRRHLYSLEKSEIVKKVEDHFKLIPNVVFINNYDNIEFTDDFFVDNSHFSKEGALKYTELISSQLGSLLK